MGTALTNWTFLTNHTHVLICLLRDPESRIRDIAAKVGVTERAVQRMVSELAEAGVLVIKKTGRRNSYEVFLDAPLRHEVEKGHTIGQLINFILS